MHELTSTHRIACVFLWLLFHLQIDSALVKDSVRQLIMLAKTDDPLYQFEGAMALTTVATLDDETKHLVVATDGGLDLLEKLQMSDHVMVRRVRCQFWAKLNCCARVGARC